MTITPYGVIVKEGLRRWKLGQRMIDVREYPEFAGGHVEGSVWVRLSELEKASETWARTDTLTLVCGTGVRAEQARTLLAARVRSRPWIRIRQPPDLSQNLVGRLLNESEN